MPNVKLYVDEGVLRGVGDRLDPALTGLRDFLCRSFGVTEDICHIVVLGVRSAPGQTPVNIELAILQKRDRPREVVDASCAELQSLAAGLFGTRVAIRCSLMDPEFYVVRR